MFDLETMAVSPRATVLTIGAVKFSPHANGYGDKLYMRVNIDDQDVLGREIDPNTLDFWAKQDPVIMEEAFSPLDRVPLAEAVDKFHKFCWGADAFWSHGSVFDVVIMEDLYRQLERTPPWSFWQIRDTRTIFDLGFDPDMPKGGKHDALQDAIRQAVGVQNIYAKLKIRPK
jgi:exodeoxyribonuclease VIII